MSVLRASVACWIVMMLPAAAAISADPAGGKIIEKQDVVYGRVHGAGLLADIAYPESDKPIPAIISVHGGRWRGGHKRDGSSIVVKQWAGFGLFAMSLSLVWGRAGLLTFGHAVFFGIGGYGMAFLTMGLFGDGTLWALLARPWVALPVSVAGAVLLVMTFFNLSMGVMGRALFPDQSVLPGGSQDAIYPYLVGQFDIVGLKGLVVAGILAAALSTYDSIGSTLSALLTRDVYARLLVRDRDDRHYLRVGQYLTPVIIASSFLYVPFLLEGGMLLFYIDLTSALVIPLLTLFLMGAMTRVHRKSGVIGLVVGTLYGVLRLLAPLIAEHFGVAVLPRALVNTYMAYPFSMLLTGSVMVLVSAFAGWEPRGISLVRNQEQSPWLRTSQLAVRELQEEEDSSARALPAYLAVALFAVGCLLSFVVLW